MAIAVVGFDIGCSTSYIAVAKQGGIETIANEYSDRQTPTYVGFADRQRVVGLAAKLQQVSNTKNTIFNFTPLLGKSFCDSHVADEIRFLPYTVTETKDGRVCIEVTYQEETCTILPEQVFAMQLTKLRKITEANLDAKVVDVVINVPTYYTDSERRAVLDASRIAGLNCVKLVNDITAIGTAYGLYNKDLPEIEKAPRVVAFVNVGYVGTQVAICAFNSGKMRVIASSCNPHLGGRDFDRVIYSEAAHHFEEKYNLKLSNSPKAVVKLMIECEKLKKGMSANSQELQVVIECLMHEKDLNMKMKRTEFESLCDSLFCQFEEVLTRCMSLGNLSAKDIHSVELVGGSSRIPALKNIVASVFGQDGRTTLNADEAVARGCALQAAICSPAYKVRDFSVTEACPYAIGLLWNKEDNTDQNCTEISDLETGINIGNKDNFLEVFPCLHPIPSSRFFTFKRRGPFSLDARYLNADALPNQNVTIGTFSVAGVPLEDSKVRIKVRINPHGIFSVSKAEIAEEYEKEVEVDVPQTDICNNGTETEEPPKAMETEVPINGDASKEPKLSENQTQTADKKVAKPKTKKTLVKKKAIRYKDLPIDASVMQLTTSAINELCEAECKMAEQDELEHRRSHAKNSVEEYVYDMRNKLQDSLCNFATNEERSKLSNMLEATEDWLYGDGEYLLRQAYVDKLDSLKVIGDRIVMRANEHMTRGTAIHNLERSIVQFRKVLESIARKEDTFSHIPAEQLEQISNCLSQHETWLRKEMRVQDGLPLNQDPALRTEQIVKQHDALESVCRHIVNTPKPVTPQPPPPPAAENNNTVANDTSPAEDSVSASGKKGVKQNVANSLHPETMDVD